MTKKKPILFITIGFPGSGKTYFARRFAKQFGIIHLNSDKVRSELFKKPKYDRKFLDLVFNEMDRRAEKFLSEGKSVIYDANVTKRIFRKKLQNIARTNRAKYLLLWFQAPVNIAIGRSLKRKKLKSEFLKKYHVPIDKWVILRIRKATESPTRSEHHIIINGEKLYEEQVRAIKKYL